MQGNRVTCHLETRHGAVSIHTAVKCLLRIEMERDVCLNSIQPSVYLRTTLTNRNEVYYEIMWLINHEMLRVIQSTCRLFSRMVMRIKKLHIVVYGCKTWSFILVNDLNRSLLSRTAQIPGATSPELLNSVWWRLQF